MFFDGCRGLDAGVPRPAAAGEGGQQGWFFDRSAVRLIMCAAVLFDLRFLPHIDYVVLLILAVVQVVWITGASRGIGQHDL